MFKNHPKGLVILSLANMGERFGYYTMLAIFVLFIQAKFGYDSTATSNIFAIFLAFVYFLPLLGGIIADRFLGYGRTIILGIVIMFGGYLLLAVPTGVSDTGKAMMFGALALIALGTGFFKGNLQALLGNMYDDPKYNSKRDLAYSIFYMCINIGAFFAPSAAEAVTNHFLAKSDLTYNAAIPSLAHQYINGTINEKGLETFTTAAEGQMSGASANLAEFGQMYIDKLSESYNYGFAVACISLIISLLIFILFRKTYKKADVTARQQKAADEAAGTKTLETLSPAETKERIIALCLVFAVVIFFWMAFHQNGLTLTFFARDYTVDTVSGFDRFSFGLPTMLMAIVGFYGLLSLITSSAMKSRIIGGIVFVLAAVGGYYLYNGMPEILSITPQRFQQFNPFFIIILTPLSVGLFSLLSKKGKEPSAPRKIGYGMLIAALGFVVMSLGSFGLPTPNEVEAAGGYNMVTPNLLIGTYFTLTIAELFLSPMGLSFVSKVAPPQYKGMMQGGWLAATAVGNYAVAIIGYLWGGMQLWLVWGILVVLCIIAAAFIFSIMKRLEKVAK